MSEALEQERLRLLLDYDPLTGIFRWRSDSYEEGAKSHRGGDVAGVADDKGYLRISLGRSRFMAHRLAWFYMRGEWPADQVDHRNLNKADNSWGNLRAATNGQNKANSPRYRNNSSGFKGVYLRENGRFRAAMSIDGKLLNLGTFDTAEEAHRAYARAAVKHYGEFARVA